ncbi:hypothetical protein N9A04_00425, partial [Rickettsiales bacterium]|nr:hypothetical protein [Rickettsiales bacterium]
MRDRVALVKNALSQLESYKSALLDSIDALFSDSYYITLSKLYPFISTSNGRYFDDALIFSSPSDYADVKKEASLCASSKYADAISDYEDTLVSALSYIISNVTLPSVGSNNGITETLDSKSCRIEAKFNDSIKDLKNIMSEYNSDIHLASNGKMESFVKTIQKRSLYQRQLDSFVGSLEGNILLISDMRIQGVDVHKFLEQLVLISTSKQHDSQVALEEYRRYFTKLINVRLGSLSTLIRQYKHEYYILSNPSVDDAVYDVTEERLRIYKNIQSSLDESGRLFEYDFDFNVVNRPNVGVGSEMHDGPKDIFSDDAMEDSNYMEESEEEYDDVDSAMDLFGDSADAAIDAVGSDEESHKVDKGLKDRALSKDVLLRNRKVFKKKVKKKDVVSKSSSFTPQVVTNFRGPVISNASSELEHLG